MRNPIHFLLLAIVATALVYWPGLTGPFMFDDTYNLAPLNEWLQGNRSWQWVVFNNTSGLFGRPVAMASFVLNINWLGPEVQSLKLGNLILHLLNGILVYSLFTALSNQGAFTQKLTNLTKWLPVIGAALWLLHPLLVSTVLYVVQRMAMLSALFTLLAMLAYLHGRIALNTGRNARALLLLLLVPFFTLLAALSKENGLLVPAFCGLIELFVFMPKSGEKRPFASLAIIIMALVLPAILAVTLTLAEHPLIVGGYDNRPFTLGERLLTQSRVLWSYIGSLLMPNGPRLGLYHDDFTISRGLFEPVTTLIALLAWTGLLVATYRLRRSTPGFGLGIGIFLVGHSLESSVFPLLMYFEHRNYLSSTGVMLALISLGTHAANHMQHRLQQPQRMLVFLTCALLATFAFTTFTRASIWSSESSILANGLKTHPDSRWLRMEASSFAMRQQPPQSDTARRHMQHLLLQPSPDTNRIAAAAMLLIDCRAGIQADNGLLRKAFDGQPDPIEADKLLIFERLADGLASQPCPGLPPALAAEKLSMMLDRSNLPKTHSFLRRLRFKSAKLYYAAGEPNQALIQARLAYNGDRSDAPITALIVELEIEQGRLQEAAKMLNVLDSQIATDDRIGREILQRLHSKLKQSTQ